MTAKIGLQLYSLGDEMASDPEGTIKWIAEEGFKTVELHRVTSNTDKLLELLEEHALARPMANARPLEMPADEQKRIFEASAKLGAKTLIESRVEAEHWATPEGARKVADQLNQTAAVAKQFGLKFGYHVHNHEVDIEYDGKSAIEYAEPFLDPEMLIQVDTWWGTRGGKDLAAVTRRLGKRVTTVHVKDGPNGTLQGQTAAGSGDVDIMAVLEAAPHAQYAIIEFDRRRFSGDPFKAIAESRQYLISKGLVE